MWKSAASTVLCGKCGRIDLNNFLEKRKLKCGVFVHKIIHIYFLSNFVENKGLFYFSSSMSRIRLETSSAKAGLSAFSRSILRMAAMTVVWSQEKIKPISS